MKHVFRIFTALMLLTPVHVAAEDITWTEKKLQDKVKALELEKQYFEKLLEVATAKDNLETKRKDIATKQADAAEANLKAAQAAEQGIPSGTPKISTIEAEVVRIDAPDKKCDASAYFRYHCKAKQRCIVELSEAMCKLPGPVDNPMTVSVFFKCGGEKDFAKEEFRYEDAKAYVTCAGR